MGMLANLVEFPAVPKGQARFRLQVMAKHAQADVLDAVYRLSTAVADATDDLEALESGRASLETLDRDCPLPSARSRQLDPEPPVLQSLHYGRSAVA